jgi:transcriptional regulator of acetoin/glycerol metabolism
VQDRPTPTPPADEGVAMPTRRLSRQKLQELLREHEGNVTAIATHLGVGRNTLYRWLKVVNLDASEFRR